MPIAIRKLPNKDLYKVYNKITGEIHSKATTKEKAEAQKRLLDNFDKVKNIKKKI